MVLFLHFYYTTYVGAKRTQRVAATDRQLKSTTLMSTNGHLMDGQNGNAEAVYSQNNNSVVDSSRERKEQ